MQLSAKSVKIIKATSKVVSQNAEAITIRMYQVLFEHYPQTKALFMHADASQHKTLAETIAAYATHIDNIALLDPVIKKISTIHIHAGVTEEHYPMVGDVLLAAIKDILGDSATDEVLEAWREAYFFLADILIAKEKELASLQGE